MSDQRRLSFVSDYMEGCHPEILRRLQETNLLQSPGYGLDEFSASAKERIREACGDPEADIFSPTNQIFIVLNEKQKDWLTSQVEMGFMEKTADGEYVMRFATSWATRMADVEALIHVLEKGSAS